MDTPAVLVRFFALTALLVCIIWTVFLRGGVSIRTLHPLLMVIAFGFCMPLAAVQFRHPLLQGTRHPIKKLIHVCLHFLALAALLASTIIVIVVKRAASPAKPHFYSAHSCIGIIVVFSAVLQFGLGLGFLYLSPAMRKALSSVHKPMGFVVIIAGLAVILTGLCEAQSGIKGAKRYKGAAVTVSVLCLLGLGILASVITALYVPAPKADDPPQQADPCKPVAPVQSV